MPNMELLKQKGDYLNTYDMMAVLRIGGTALWKYEKGAIDGFPRSSKICGKKMWPKQSVIDYINGCDHKAAEVLKKMVKIKYAVNNCSDI